MKIRMTWGDKEVTVEDVSSVDAKQTAMQALEEMKGIPDMAVTGGLHYTHIGELPVKLVVDDTLPDGVFGVRDATGRMRFFGNGHELLAPEFKVLQALEAEDAEVVPVSREDD